MRGRRYACLLICLLCAGTAQAGSGFVIEESDVAGLQAEMAAGRLNARGLAEHYLARIEALDRNGPRLSAVIELNPDALAIADALDRERRAQGARGPLHGIPVLLKDNIDTADRMLTTAGSLALIGSRPRADAHIVTRLRAAGAVILGKTNLSEWANFRSTRASSGWSGRGGQTRNPYALDRNPCGSSSGSGVAVSANLAALAVGTETDGSIVCPASVNGIVGLKPTVGLVSRSGIVPISASQDIAGPMTRSVADAALLLDVLAGSDAADATTATADTRRAAYATALGSGDLKGLRLGVARNLGGFHEGVDALFEQALAALAAAGAELVDPIELPKPEAMDAAEYEVLLYEFKDGLNRYLAGRDNGPRTLAELIAFNAREPRLEMPWFGQEIFIAAEAKGPLSESAYRKARATSLRLAGREGIDAVLKKHRLDALVAPTMGVAWTTDPVNGDHYLGGGASQAAAIAGYPHLTVPAGQLHGLPVGLSVIGPAWSEPILLRAGYAYEQATHARRAPEFKPSIP